MWIYYKMSWLGVSINQPFIYFKGIKIYKK